MSYELTERERNIVYLLANGFKNEEIGNRLNISVHTVKAHLESIFYKFRVANRMQAIIKAAQNKIVDIDSIKIEEKQFL